MNSTLTISLIYTFGWFWSLYMGSAGRPFLASFGALYLLAVQLYLIKSKNPLQYAQDILLVIFALVLGFFLEVIFVATGTLHYFNGSGLFPPIWIVTLYPLFALWFNRFRHLFNNSYGASFLVGFLGAPLSYKAGEALGGASFTYPPLVTWLIIGIAWGGWLCWLTAIAVALDKAASEALAELNLNSPLKLLYDGECPLCKREVDMLRRRGEPGRVEFIDITSEPFLSSKTFGIDYETAMTEMHAIDPNGKVLVGLKAFEALYARCRLLSLSLFLRLPFVESALKPLYKLFAKNRLRLTGRCDINCKRK